MKPLLFLALAVMMAGCDIKIAERTYIKPAENWNWRCCTTEWWLSGTFTACSSPMTYDQAMWWKEMRGKGPVPEHGPVE